jgi:peptidoglycan/xylan/chitin deacetylase (PgdA/CDA1 family)
VLDWSELRRLHAQGVAIGVHTRHHAGLTHVTEARARSEIRESIEDVRREIGEQPIALAYPYGMHDQRVVEIARQEGCLLGFTCEDGLNDAAATHPLRVRRTNVTRKTRVPAFMLRMLPWFARVDRWRHGRGSRGGHA